MIKQNKKKNLTLIIVEKVIKYNALWLSSDIKKQNIKNIIELGTLEEFIGYIIRAYDYINTVDGQYVVHKIFYLVALMELAINAHYR